MLYFSHFKFQSFYFINFYLNNFYPLYSIQSVCGTTNVISETSQSGKVSVPLPDNPCKDLFRWCSDIDPNAEETHRMIIGWFFCRNFNSVHRTLDNPTFPSISVLLNNTELYFFTFFFSIDVNRISNLLDYYSNKLSCKCH